MNLFSKLLIVGMAIITFSCDNEKDPETNASKTNTTAALAITPKKFLFDATKAETAGNADWVIDADTSPQRFPTPAQSNITATTTEKFLERWFISMGCRFS